MSRDLRTMPGPNIQQKKKQREKDINHIFGTRFQNVKKIFNKLIEKTF